MSRRRIALAVGVAAALLALVAVPQLGAQDTVDRVERAVDPGSCASVEVGRSREERPPFAARWRDATATAIVECRHLGDSAFYARFPSSVALESALAQEPPVHRTCDYAKDKWTGTVQQDPMTAPAAAFRRWCDDRHGDLDEGTYAYCLAGTEVVVGSFSERAQFKALCRELHGAIHKPLASAATS